MSAVILL